MDQVNMRRETACAAAEAPLPDRRVHDPYSCRPVILKSVGRFLILAGVALVVLGLIAVGVDRMGIHLGRLPGDIRIQGKRGGFYFPVVTCILISVLLSLISWLFTRR
jgi:hypothetical protein